MNAHWKGKGSKKEANTHRGLAIGSTVCKIALAIILNRLQPWYDQQLTDNQFGFRKNRGTTDGIYVTKRIQQIISRKLEPGYLLFVDLSAAFDHVVRKWLWATIRSRFGQANTTLIDILENLYAHTTYTFNDESFPTLSGVRQGGPESPLLFNLFLDYVMRIFMQEASKDPEIRFFTHKSHSDFPNSSKYVKKCKSTLPWSGYADDLILYLIEKFGLQRATNLLNKIFLRFGLKINLAKTEPMTLNHTALNPTETYPKSITSVDTVKLKNTETFRYLGTQINENQPNTGDSEIEYRINCAKAAFAEHQMMLKNHNIRIALRILFLNAMVRSRLTYSCQTWNLSVKQSDRLNVVYRGFLRRMMKGGFRRKTGSDQEETFHYRYTNENVHSICKTIDVCEFIQDQQRKYTYHIIRSDWNNSTKKLMFNADTYRKRGRHVPTLVQQVTKANGHDINGTITSALNREH